MRLGKGCKFVIDSKGNTGNLWSPRLPPDARRRLEGDKVAERSDRRGLPEAAC